RYCQLGTRRMVTNDAQRSTGAKAKWLEFFSVEAGVNVVGHCARFTQGKLRSRRIRSPCLAVAAGGAVSQSPQSRMARHGQCAINYHCAPFVELDWEQAKQWVRGSACRPY